MGASASSPFPEKGMTESRSARVAQLGASLAQGLSTGIRRLTYVAVSAAVVLWAALFVPTSLHPTDLLLGGMTLVGLLSPATILGLSYVGLRDLLALPNRLAIRTSASLDQSVETARALSDDAPSGLWDRLKHVLRQIWALRHVLLENRALLTRYGTLLRFLTPGFLLLTILAVVATLMLAVGAALALLLVGLF